MATAHGQSEPTPATAEAAETAEAVENAEATEDGFEEFDLDDIEVIESKVFG